MMSPLHQMDSIKTRKKTDACALLSEPIPVGASVLKAVPGSCAVPPHHHWNTQQVCCSGPGCIQVLYDCQGVPVFTHRVHDQCKGQKEGRVAGWGWEWECLCAMWLTPRASVCLLCCISCWQNGREEREPYFYCGVQCNCSASLSGCISTHAAVHMLADISQTSCSQCPLCTS
jgi:hypothetical protein